MIRPWQIILAFGLCLALVVGAMTWVSWTALKLDRAQAQARRQAAVSLALWRMDSALAPLIARENSRPYFAWNPFYLMDRAYAGMFADIGRGDRLVASPLLTDEAQDVLLYFQMEPSGIMTSPQVPPERLMPLARQLPAGSAGREDFSRRLEEITAHVDRSWLLWSVPPASPGAMQAVAIADSGSAEHRASGAKAGAAEYAARAQNIQQAAQAVQQSVNPYLPQQPGPEGPPVQLRGRDAPSRPPPPSASQQASLPQEQHVVPAADIGQVTVGLMTPVWASDRLLLVRHARVNGQSYVQGCWLDWAGIRQRLLDGIRDILPAAQLEPVQTEPFGETQRSRMLAALPVRLLPGEMPAGSNRTITPIRLSLLLAWGCVLLAAGAVAVLLAGTVALSERRAAFVSAVTHELRTPLTTLRMYAEMLAAGMIGEPDKRQHYLDTLQREADRLGHLVENVLAYAQLERGHFRGRIKAVPLDQLLARVTERLASRATQAGMQLSVSCRDDAAQTLVKADQSAVEQILFNLVDNACKYAVAEENRGIELSMGCDGRSVFLCVRDHGPGISAQDARRLFRPFAKSARDAANSAPGVGLGLALSRRLARQMNGHLHLDPHVQPGACFVLTLPIASGEGL